MKKIDVRYIGDEHTIYIWVRPIEAPPTGGHKALKNEDFIDHHDKVLRQSYYKQVTEKRLTQRYLDRVSVPMPATRAEIAHNEALGVNKKRSIPQIEDKPLWRIPIVDEE